MTAFAGHLEHFGDSSLCDSAQSMDSTCCIAAGISGSVVRTSSTASVRVKGPFLLLQRVPLQLVPSGLLNDMA